MYRVLVVEDSPTQAQQLRLVLQERGYEVVVAGDGEEGLEKATQGEFDVVLSDVVMPKLNGYELCASLKKDERTADTPVVLITALRDPMDIVQGLQAGADNFITKPYDPAYLLTRIETTIATRDLRARSRFKMGVELLLMGKRVEITSEKEQILDMLISTFEEYSRAYERELRYKLEEAQQRAEAEKFRIQAEFLEKEREKEAEFTHALKESEERFRSYFEDDLAGHLIIRPDGGIVAANQACATILGFDSVDELLRHGADDLYAEQETRDEILERVGSREKLEDVEMQVRRKDGSIAHVIANVVGSFNGGETLQEIKAYFFDVTEKKRLEEQLQQAQKLEAIGRLAGGVAHDFNNLLTAIGGYAGLVLKKVREDDLRSDLAEIVRAAERAEALTRQLLAFGRRQVIDPRVLDLNSVVADMDKLLQRVIGEDIDLETHLAPDLGRVKTDPNHIEQVVLNLAVNARDAMPLGGKLTIETANVELGEEYARTHADVQPGRHVMLAVSDTGVGMDEETLSHVFEPFFTTKEDGKGTGLGLATVHGIVHQSGGHIWVYSAPGEGTTFKVYLPRVEEEVDRREESAPPPDAIHGDETILLVEDEEVVRKLAERVLAERGYRVVAHESPEEALVAAGELEQIDLVVTDMVMPGMGGRELAERLRERLGRPHLKVLFMSGYTDRVVVRHGLMESLEVPFLQKPFNPETLALRVRQVLDALGDEEGP